MDHCGKLVDFGHIARAEAVFVKNDAVVFVHAPRDTGQEMVSHVEVPGDVLDSNEIWDVFPFVLIRFLLGVKPLPELRVIGHSFG